MKLRIQKLIDVELSELDQQALSPQEYESQRQSLLNARRQLTMQIDDIIRFGPQSFERQERQAKDDWAEERRIGVW
jgi:hypothetical protein